MQTDRASYLSKENTHCLKGILALGILVHHLSQYSGLSFTGSWRIISAGFQALGFVCVAVFLFLSGYGLSRAYREKPTYTDGFFTRKILPFYCIIAFFTVLYIVFYEAFGVRPSAKRILLALTFGKTLIKNGWYLKIQLVYYVLFFLIYRQTNNKHKLLTMLLAQIAFAGLCFAADLSAIRYERFPIFVFGMLWAEKQELLEEKLLKDRYWIWQAVLMLALFGALYTLSCRVNAEWLSTCIRMLCYFPFTLFVLITIRHIPIQNAVSRFFGKISLELYVMQGMALMLFRHYHFKTVWYLPAAAFSSVGLALLTRPVMQWIYKAFRGTKKQE